MLFIVQSIASTGKSVTFIPAHTADGLFVLSSRYGKQEHTSKLVLDCRELVHIDGKGAWLPLKVKFTDTGIEFSDDADVQNWEIAQGLPWANVKDGLSYRRPSENEKREFVKRLLDYVSGPERTTTNTTQLDALQTENLTLRQEVGQLTELVNKLVNQLSGNDVSHPAAPMPESAQAQTDAKIRRKRKEEPAPEPIAEHEAKPRTRKRKA